MKSLVGIIEKLKEVDDLYEHYVQNENMPDYSLPVLRASLVCEILLVEFLRSHKLKIQDNYVLIKGERLWVIDFWIKYYRDNSGSTFQDFFKIIREYRTRMKKDRRISRGEMNEFIIAYHSFLLQFFPGICLENVFRCSEKDKEELGKYLSSLFPDFDPTVGDPEVSVVSLNGVAMTSAALATLGGLAVGALGGGGLIIGGIGMALGEATIVAPWSFFRRHSKGQNAHDNIQPPQTPEGGGNRNIAGLDELYELINQRMQSATDIMTEALQDSSKEIVVRLDNMTKILENILEKITTYQKLVEKQLELAVTADEVDRIIHAYSDLCSEQIVSELEKRYSEEAREGAKKDLILSLGESAWEKLLPSSQNYLISAKVTFAYYNKMNSLDYSGVCLLVTKSLETEMKRRFYTDFLEYVKGKHSDSYRTHLEDIPMLLQKKYKRAWCLKKEKEITLGTIPILLGATCDSRNTVEQNNRDRAIVLQYVKEVLWKEALPDNQIEEMLQHYGNRISEITEKYRNRAAHTNQINRMDAKECMELVLDVEKLLKQILDSFRY